MKKSLLLFFVIFSSTSFLMGQPIVLNKDIIIRQEQKQIYDGGKTTIFGKEQSRPDIYLQDNGDSFQAVRLTVSPNFDIDRWVPYLQAPTDTSIVISWKTKSNALSPIVEYGLTESGLDGRSQGTTQLLRANFNYHTVTLSGLKPNTKYYYKVSGDNNLYFFRTQPANGDTRKYRILVLGDHQIVDRSGYDWLISAARKTIEKKYGGSLEDHIDLILNDGDQVDQGTIDYYERGHFFKSRHFSPYVPIMTTVGNHEFVNDSELQLYKKFFAYEGIRYKKFGSRADAYYAMQLGRLLLVSLCTDEPYTTTKPNQDIFLQRVMDSVSVDPSIDFVLSVCHRPMVAETYSGDYSSWLRRKAVPILGSSPKHVLNIAAHHHYYQRGQVEDYPFFHIISGGASWDQIWRECPDLIDDNSVQKTFDYWAYQILEFDPVEKTMSCESYSIGNRDVVHNNILIDSFVRDLKSKGKPSRPLVVNEKKLALPASIVSSLYVKNDAAEFNTCQFQIATDASFRSLIIDKMLHRDNYFFDQGKPYFIPINTQAGKSPFELSLDKGALNIGSYYVRVRHRDEQLSWSDWSESMPLEIVSSSSVEEVERPSLRFFPNPVKDRLYIESTCPVTIELVDICGRVLSRVENVEGALDLSDLPAGIYGIRAYENNKVVYKTFIKN